MWFNIKNKQPKPGREVLVWVDGHRGPAWPNNYALVAVMLSNGTFFEERHGNDVIGVTHWKTLPIGPKK